jgi:putative N-acetylmannosamine-6-phosphate epimerase/predicted NBD/HSP70 family sugar kinase
LTLLDLLAILKKDPVIASAQASPGSPLDDPEILVRLAEASLGQGVKVIRSQGLGPIWMIKQTLGVPVIGLIKEAYPGSEVYITPTRKEVEELIQTGCEVIALDATRRPRPGGEKLADLVQIAKQAGRLVMADCDGLDSARYAIECGADLIGTTLSGYTAESRTTDGPDLDLVRDLLELGHPVIAEGRYQEPWQAQAALGIGATAVVIGGALNDPVKQTARFVGACRPLEEVIGAVDLGGTWLRFGLIGDDGAVFEAEKVKAPRTHRERRDWIADRLAEHNVKILGVSAGGVIDPRTSRVLQAKGFIHDYVGGDFNFEGVRTRAVNDGLAHAWGHACLPHYSGKRLAVLTFGSGVGAGFVDQGRLIVRNGWASSFNDMTYEGDETMEDVLGGLALSEGRDAMARERAIAAARRIIEAADLLWMPDTIVIGGGVGLSDWMQAALVGIETRHASVEPTPLGENAGLWGAGALAATPPAGVFE